MVALKEITKIEIILMVTILINVATSVETLILVALKITIIIITKWHY